MGQEFGHGSSESSAVGRSLTKRHSRWQPGLMSHVKTGLGLDLPPHSHGCWQDSGSPGLLERRLQFVD